MIKYLCLAAGLVLASATAAQACSPSQMVMTGEQNYQALIPSSYSSWTDPELSVGLVYTKKTKTRKKEVYAGFGDGPQKKPFVKNKIQGHSKCLRQLRR